MTAARRPDEPHPGLDTLADLDAGVLEGADAERVAGHVAGCARCGQVMAALGGVRADLRTLPAPPLPAAVAARLDATLAELRTAADGAAPARTDRTDRVAAAPATAQVTDLEAARRWRRLKAAGTGVAAALVLVVAGTSVVSLVRSAGGGDDSTSAAGGGSGAETREQQQDTAAVPGAAAPSLPPLPDFDEASLRAALPTLVTAYAVDRVTETAAEGPANGPAGAMADSGLRTACVRTIPGTKGQLSAVRWIRYDGRPAYVFVFSDGGSRTAYVVGDQCGRVPAVPATLLDTVR
jgi:hypothetical protein